MKRREIWWVNFDPSIGGEIKKKRPAVIVSNDAANKFLNRVQVVQQKAQIYFNQTKHQKAYTNIKVFFIFGIYNPFYTDGVTKKAGQKTSKTVDLEFPHP